MLFISDTLFLHWKTPLHEVSRLLSRWLSGSRDRHAGPEGPPRKKRKRQQETTAGPSVADSPSVRVVATHTTRHRRHLETRPARAEARLVRAETSMKCRIPCQPACE